MINLAHCANTSVKEAELTNHNAIEHMKNHDQQVGGGGGRLI